MVDTHMTSYIPELTRRALIISCALLVFGGFSAIAAQKRAQVSRDTAAAIRLYEMGETDAAIMALRKITFSRQDDFDAWYYLGLAYSRQGPSHSALLAFERAVALQSDHADAAAKLATLLVLGGDMDRARAFANQAISLGVNDAAMHYVKAEAYRETGDDLSALEEANESLRLDAGFTDAWLTKARALRALKRDRDAADALEAYLSSGPDDGDTPLWREELVRWEAALQSNATSRDSFDPSVPKPNKNTVRARILSKPTPSYTDRARKAGVAGTVQIQVVLQSNGEVGDIRVVRWLRFGLTTAAVNAAKQIKFEPATIDGRPVSQFVRIDYSFNIH